MKKLMFLVMAFWAMLSVRALAQELPWVSMDNVREIGSGYVWADTPVQEYGSENGFEPIAMSPETAYETLREAYYAGGDEATKEILNGWGVALEPCGYPLLRDLTDGAETERMGIYGIPDVRVIGFSGWGWGEEGTLIFVECWPQWYLWDYAAGGCEDIHFCAGGEDAAAFLELKVIGHGTGCYAEYVDVYNLGARRIEASYTSEGYEVFQDYGVQVYGAACYARDGVHIFRSLSPLQLDETVNEYVPTGTVLDEFVYRLDIPSSDTPREWTDYRLVRETPE